MAKEKKESRHSHSSSSHSKHHSKSDTKDKKNKKDKHHSKDKGERNRNSEKKEGSDEMLQGELQISAEDYFTKNEEFRLWLKMFRKKNFEDLSSEECREIFEEKFVRDYNKGKLPEMYYEGNIPLELRDSSLRTEHKWNFKLSESEQTKLADLSEDVDSQTRTTSDLLNANSSSFAMVGPTTAPRRPVGPHLPCSDQRGAYAWGSGSGDSRRELSGDAKHSYYGPTGATESLSIDFKRSAVPGGGGGGSHGRLQQQQQQHRKEAYAYAREVVDDLAPDSRNKSAAQRRAGASAAVHGAHRAREDTRDGVELPESVLMGGPSGPEDDLRSVLAKQAAYKERRLAQQQDHAKQLQERQSEREESFFAKLGIDPSKGRITIAPRPQS